ncbi:MAG: PIN domain-containing protein [Salinibacter sp.]
MTRVLVDTSVWIEYFNRPTSAEQAELMRLLDGDAASLAGVVLAELLQGAKSERERDLLRETLDAFPLLPASRATWERVGELAFGLRRRGRTLPLSDLLIASPAIEHEHPVYTLDPHFDEIPDLPRPQPPGG